MENGSSEGRFTALRMLERQNTRLMQQLSDQKAETLRYKAQLDKVFANFSQGDIFDESGLPGHTDCATQTVECADYWQPENAALRLKVKRLEAEREQLLDRVYEIRQKQQVIEHSQLVEASFDSANLNESIGAQRANVMLLSSCCFGSVSYQLCSSAKCMRKLSEEVEECLACATAMCSCVRELQTSTLRLDRRLDYAFTEFVAQMHARLVQMSVSQTDAAALKEMEAKLAQQREEIIDLQQARIEDIRRCSRIVDEMRGYMSGGRRYIAGVQQTL